MKKLLIFLLALFGLFIGGFFGVGMYAYTTNGYIATSFEYSYNSNQLNATQDLYLRADVGDIYIEYNQTKMPETMKVNMKIYLNGPYLDVKSYTDYFNPVEWQNSSNSASFILEKLPNRWPGRDNWFYRDGNELRVILRTDLTYNITIFSVEGTIRMDSPVNANVNKLDLTTSIGDVALFCNRSSINGDISLKSHNGDLYLNFTKCNFGGNINSITYTGDIRFNSYLPSYLVPSDWQINTTNGDIRVLIYQDDFNMNSNVNASFNSVVGDVVFDYSDNSTQLGAQFTGTSGFGVLKYESEDQSFGRFGNVFKSIDYETSVNKYKINMQTDNGYIVVRAKSSSV
jgi:DUF4097 and DUF4098 domain-containing protein YvlB